jgi:hypothetical protein
MSRPASAPPAILLLVPNLLFGASIAQAVQATGAQVRPCRNAAAFLAALEQPAELAGAVVDLGGNPGWEPVIRAAAAAGVPVFAFGPHLDAATLKGAREAGASRVVANSAHAKELPKWLAAQVASVKRET